METIKCTFLGDDGTCLLTSYAENKFPTEYVPTVFGGYSISIMVRDVPYTLGVFDTWAGSSWDRDNERLRPLSYPILPSVFLVLFSVGMPVSFHNVKHNGVPRVVGATQIDLRQPQADEDLSTPQQQRILTTTEGEKLARQVNAAAYVECSAKTHEGVHAAFDAAIVAAVKYQERDILVKRKKLNCVVV
ncbi:P-loop containing nucleoside triphosphate hydrolase protein [Mycena haematopus]|nr:P-loop containing nucleoside triphosphate hydrolase protein [Mycena haematopus]